MYFNSYLFIFLFVPITLLGYYILNHFKKYRPALAWVVFASLVFYSWANLPLFFLIASSIAGNFICSLLMKKTGKNKLFGILGIVFDLGLLFYFKYFDFFISNMNAAFGFDWALQHIALPMGISFYTFQQISYMADRMKGKADHYGLLDYMSFVTFFPQLVAGPIVKHSDLVPQFLDEKKRKFDWVYFTKGVILFVFGLAKKVLLADLLALGADYAFNNVGSLDSLSSLAGILAFTFQLYFDFSGYCDMAIGLGWMFNIDLPLNFDRPYLSCSIKEFWRRWHITLGKFFTEYVYIPLGGSRKGKARALLNTLIVFLLSGIWHGAAWTYILWGFSQGVFITVETIFEKPLAKLEENKAGKKIKGFVTFLLILGFLVVFRANSLSDIPAYYSRLFSFSANGNLTTLAYEMDNALLHIPGILAKKIGGEVFYQGMYIAYVALLILISMILCRGKTAYQYVSEGRYGKKLLPVLSILFFFSVISLSKVVVFLYSNF